ncbi:MAG: fatty acid desaturase [Myxococcaceae bacterium]
MTRSSALFGRRISIQASRLTVLAVLGTCLWTYFQQPEGALEWTLDILFRAYLHFIAGVMAHEATHGHLGSSRAANLWWGRVALTPTMVPYAVFRKTHILHHRHTNIADEDPDAYLNTRHLWQVPLRAVSMPYHWLRWLRTRGLLTRELALELALTWAFYAAIAIALASQVGWARVLSGYFPAGILHALLLWYPFAIKTHEGYSTGDERERSHDYHGKLAYWFSFGLSLHRVHHLKPHLGWLEMFPFIQPCSWWQALTFRRDVQKRLQS